MSPSPDVVVARVELAVSTRECLWTKEGVAWGRTDHRQLVRVSGVWFCPGMVRAQGLRWPRERKGQWSRLSGEETKVSYLGG